MLLPGDVCISEHETNIFTYYSFCVIFIFHQCVCEESVYDLALNMNRFQTYFGGSGLSFVLFRSPSYMHLYMSIIRLSLVKI